MMLIADASLEGAEGSIRIANAPTAEECRGLVPGLATREDGLSSQVPRSRPLALVNGQVT